MNREIYVCIRFSEKASMRMDSKSFNNFVKRLRKEMLPKLAEHFKKVDNKAKVWIATG